MRACRRVHALSADRVRLNWQRYVPRRVDPAHAPLLLIHGFGCGSNDWGALPRIVATQSQRPVITFDNRGIGQSSAPEGPYTVQEMAEDARAVVEEAGLQSVSVMGISLGGMIAQSFALAYPEATHALVLGCTTHGGRKATPPPDAFLAAAAEWASLEEPNLSPATDAFMHFMLPEEFVASERGEKLFAQFKAAFLRTRRSGVGLRGQLAAMGRFNSTRSLDQLLCPTLVISGDRDAVVPPSNSHSLSQLIPGARFQSWEGAGHFWWATRPWEAADLLARFLIECDGDPAAPAAAQTPDRP